MEVQPCNVHERAFAVTVLMFAMTVFSSFVSSITASMTQLRNMTAIFDKNLSILRRYLRAHQISSPLSIRILRYTEYKLTMRKQEIQECDVNLLRILSLPLRMDLVHETLAPVLVRHPFFDRLAFVCPPAMRELCNTAVKKQHYSLGDIIFESSDEGDRMFFPTRGQLKYTSSKRRASSTDAESQATGSHHDAVAEDSHAESQHSTPGVLPKSTTASSLLPKSTTASSLTETLLSPGEWCSEASLWLDWTCSGRLRAEDNADMLVLDAAAFAKALAAHQRVMHAAVRYSCLYLESLNQQLLTATAGDLSGMSYAELEELVGRAFGGGDVQSERQPNESALSALRHLKSTLLKTFDSEHPSQAQPHAVEGSEDTQRATELAEQPRQEQGPKEGGEDKERNGDSGNAQVPESISAT
mmetsp:Transcript_134855/g.349460  ORF Transcript_134855/g.349460 Transcript_134855/m.349460 type:complete len:414 (+) Transcript_134855:359-1600(+)